MSDGTVVPDAAKAMARSPMTKVVGFLICVELASVFAIALASAGSVDAEATAHAALSGYMAVWAICGLTALVAAVFLLVVHASERPAHA